MTEPEAGAAAAQTAMPAAIPSRWLRLIMIDSLRDSPPGPPRCLDRQSRKRPAGRSPGSNPPWFYANREGTGGLFDETLRRTRRRSAGTLQMRAGEPRPGGLQLRDLAPGHG